MRCYLLCSIFNKCCSFSRIFFFLGSISLILYTFCDEGDLVDAVVPFMGESISDGTLATFLKSMFLLLNVNRSIFLSTLREF